MIFLTKSFKKKDTFLHILFFILMFVSVFDQLRESLPIPVLLSKLCASSRDFLIIFFFYRNYKKQIKYFHVIIITLGFLCLVLGCLTVSAGAVIREFWCYAKFFLLFAIFQNEQIFIENKSYWLRLYVRMTAILFIFSIICVLFFGSILTLVFSAGLRLTVGNSSIISYLYISALLICLYMNVTKHKYAYSALFLCAIVTTVTTTAFVSLIPLFMVYFFSLGNIREQLKTVLLLFALGVLVFVVISSIEVLSNFLKYLFDKGQELGDLFGSHGNINSVGTLSARERQIQNLMNSMNIVEKILGLGFFGYTKYVTMVENQYVTLIGITGYVGFLCFLTFYLRYGFISFANLDYYSFSCFFVFGLYCYTLVMFLPYLTSFSSAFLFSQKNISFSKSKKIIFKPYQKCNRKNTSF